MTLLLSTAIIAYLVAFAIVASKNRFYGLLVLAFSLPAYGIRFSLFIIPTTLLELTIGILAIITLIQEWQQLAVIGKKISGLNRIQKTLFITLTAFLLSAVISVFTSPDLIKSLGILRAYFIEPTIVLLIALITIKNEKQIRGVIWAMAATMTIISAVAIFQRFTGWHIPVTWLAERRVTSIFSYPNAVGLYIAPLIPLTVALTAYYISQKKKLFALLLAFVTIVSMIAIVFAQTEAAIVALVGSLGFFGLLWSKKSRYTTIIGAIVVGIFLFISPPALHLVEEKLLLKDWSGFVRTTIWKETRVMLADHWLTGAGLAGYQEVFRPYHKTTFIEIFLYPHNIVMNFWTETGLYGMISFFAMVIAWIVLLIIALRNLMKKKIGTDGIGIRALALGLICSIITILIHGLVDVPFFKNDLAVQLFILIALSLAVYNESRKITATL